MPARPFASLSTRSSEQVAIGPIPIAGATVLTFLVCYFRSFIFPNIPIVLWGDQIGFYDDGSRIVSGQLPYRDFFQNPSARHGSNICVSDQVLWLVRMDS